MWPLINYYWLLLATYQEHSPQYPRKSNGLEIIQFRDNLPLILGILSRYYLASVKPAQTLTGWHIQVTDAFRNVWTGCTVAVCMRDPHWISSDSRVAQSMLHGYDLFMGLEQDSSLTWQVKISFEWQNLMTESTAWSKMLRRSCSCLLI